MECNVLGIKRKLKGADKNDGAIWILNDDCSSIFSEAYEKGSEDVIMDRGRDCLFFGVAPGEEQGAEVIFDGAYKLENEEFITGEYHMEMSSIGADCTGYRPFEIEFLEPLREKDYDWRRPARRSTNTASKSTSTWRRPKEARRSAESTAASKQAAGGSTYNYWADLTTRAVPWEKWV
jgi:hypothetical protein